MERTAYAARVRTMVRLWVFHMLPVSLQPGQPQQDLLQHRGVQLIEYEFSPAVIPDQVRLLQHRQVPGYGGGADRKVVRQFSGAFASVPQQLQYGPPGGSASARSVFCSDTMSSSVI